MELLRFDHVVEVFMLVVPRNPVNGLDILTNDSIDRFEDEPIDETIADDTRTSNFTSSTVAVGAQFVPVQATSEITPSFPT